MKSQARPAQAGPATMKPPLMLPAAASSYSALLGQTRQHLTSQQLFYWSVSHGFSRDDDHRRSYAAMAIGGGVNMRWHLVFWLCSALIGCAYFDSWEESNGGAVGRPWEEIAKLWGPEDQTWIRDDGKTIYRYHLKRLDPSCVHYWVVDEQGVIVDFYYDGYCRPIG